MELFKRFPKFHPLPREAQELVPLGTRSQYPAFQEDFKILEERLMPTFRELDNRALSRQNRYRWLYIILIFGGAMVAILGIVQLAFIEVSWIGIGEALVAIVLLLATTIQERFNDHESYLTARLAAERLRSEYFLFLGRRGQYEDKQNRVKKLKQQVLVIKAQGENMYESA